MTTNPAKGQSSNLALDRYTDLAQEIAAACCVLAGLIVLVVGWGFDVSRVRTALAGAPYMRANTAIGLLLLGAALWSNRRWPWVAGIAGATAALVGVLTVIEYAAGVNLHIDELAMRDLMRQAPGWPPGRMSLTTAVGFGLLGAGLVFSATRRAISAIQWLAIPAAGLSMASLIGYLYGVANIHNVAPYMYMALHTAATFSIVSVALLFGDPRRGAMGIVMSGAPGGVICRRLLPAAVFIPPLFGWLEWQGQRLGYFDAVCVLSLFATANVMVFGALIWIEARMLNQSDARRKGAMRDLRASAEEFRTLFESTPDAPIITDGAGRGRSALRLCRGGAGGRAGRKAGPARGAGPACGSSLEVCGRAKDTALRRRIARYSRTAQERRNLLCRRQLEFNPDPGRHTHRVHRAGPDRPQNGGGCPAGKRSALPPTCGRHAANRVDRHLRRQCRLPKPARLRLQRANLRRNARFGMAGDCTSRRPGQLPGAAGAGGWHRRSTR